MDFWYPPNGYTFGMKTEKPEYFEDKYIEHYAMNSYIEDTLRESQVDDICMVWKQASKERLFGYIHGVLMFAEYDKELFDELEQLRIWSLYK